MNIHITSHHIIVLWSQVEMIEQGCGFDVIVGHHAPQLSICTSSTGGGLLQSMLRPHLIHWRRLLTVHAQATSLFNLSFQYSSLRQRP